MEGNWFDSQTGHLVLDEYVSQMPSFRKVVADGVVTDTEVAEQAKRVADLLRRLESELTPEYRDLMREALCEFAVLNALHQRACQQSLLHH